MTRRRRLLLTVAALAVIAAVPVVVWLLMPPQFPGVTKANFDRIEIGMTKGEVSSIFAEGHSETVVNAKKNTVYIWDGLDGICGVIFDGDGKVVDRGWSDRQQTTFQRLWRLMHLP